LRGAKRRLLPLCQCTAGTEGARAKWLKSRGLTASYQNGLRSSGLGINRQRASQKADYPSIRRQKRAEPMKDRIIQPDFWRFLPTRSPNQQRRIRLWMFWKRAVPDRPREGLARKRRHSTVSRNVRRAARIRVQGFPPAFRKFGRQDAAGSGAPDRRRKPAAEIGFPRGKKGCWWRR